MVKTDSTCYGCGVCAIACSRNVLDIRQDDEGFLVPHAVNLDACTECGSCEKVCSYLQDGLCETKDPIWAAAGWSKNPETRNHCSSGGVAFEIGLQTLSEGYNPVGVSYNSTLHRAEHFVASSESEFEKSIGSKYIQSYTLDAFSKLKSKGKFSVFGTPCQIDSLRRWARMRNREKDFVFVDFFCHGVPSKNVWNQYVKLVEKQIGPIEVASWRNKDNGWHDSWVMNMKPQNDGEHWTSSRSKGDLFYRFFLSNVCLNEACYESCKFKMNSSSADLRVGDLWSNEFIQNDAGVSAVIAFTETGRSVVNRMNARCEFVEKPASSVMEGQMDHSPELPKIRSGIINDARKGRSLKQIAWVRLYPYLLIKKIRRIFVGVKK